MINKPSFTDKQFHAWLNEKTTVFPNENRDVDRRAILLEQSPHLASYMDLSQWIMKRYGDIRWRDDGQFFADHSGREIGLCVFFDLFPIMGFPSYLDRLAENLNEDVTNLWADDELHVKLVSHFRKRYLQEKGN